jgi:hypothetical protein
MVFVAKNEEVFSKLSFDNSILDSKVNKIEIDQSGSSMDIKVEFELMREKANYSKIVILFKNVIEYGFYSTNAYLGYVARLKFFKSPDQNYFYISMDPVDENENISEMDQDFIKSTEIECYSLITKTEH